MEKRQSSHGKTSIQSWKNVNPVMVKRQSSHGKMSIQCISRLYGTST